MIKIGKMAELVSVTPRTLRYYEQRGLIRPTSISPKGYRYYSMDVLPIIEKIKELQSIGLALEEIKEVIGLFSQQSRRLDAKRKMLEFMQSHLDDINGKLNLLTHMRTELSRQIRNTRRRLNQLSKGKRS
jgi:DNA-binding transcriptional MerR regulator